MSKEETKEAVVEETKAEETKVEEAKVEETKAETTDVVEKEEELSPWYVFCSQGCGFCKKAEPIYEELNASGKYPEILKLDMAEPDNQKLNKELQEEFGIQCGTPWFINADTGKSICGFREKDVLIKWLNGEDIPVPPRPKGAIPRVPLMGAPEKQITKWKKDYEKWLKQNDHLPDNQKRTADQILEQPRPKTEPPKPPIQNASDEDLEKWLKEYEVWSKENEHLPNLQPGATIVQTIKQRRDAAQGNVQNAVKPQVDNTVLNTLDARVQALEVKIDKVISHFGIK